MIFVAALVLVQTGPLPPYGESLRCEGLAVAAAKAASLDTPEGRRYFDAGLFWGLAATEAAQKAKMLVQPFKAEEQAQIERAAKEMAANDAGAKAELEACMKRVPPIKF